MNGVALLSAFALLAANGFFVAAEFAFTAASRHALADRDSRSARAAVAAIDELSFTLAGAQLGITISSLLLGFVAEPAVATLLEAAIEVFFDVPDALLHSISFAISLGIVVYLHMVLGEMAPKNVAITAPERSAIVMAVPFRAYATIFRPVIYLLNGLANLGLRMFGIDPADTHDAHTADDLASMITAGRKEGVLEEFAHRMLTGAIDLGDLDAYHVMVPRPDVMALPATTTPAEIERLVVEAGYTRIPIYGDDLDDVHGFVHAKDLLALDRSAFDRPVPTELIRPLMVVPETGAVEQLLEDLRRSRSHIALVIDEYGGTAGIVTFEDIVEEIVGEIRDEHDSEVDGVRRVSANRFLVDGSLRPDEVTRATGLPFPEGDFETIGGLIMDQIGRIPETGDRIDDGRWTMRVRRMDGRRVSDVDLIVKRKRTSDG